MITDLTPFIELTTEFAPLPPSTVRLAALVGSGDCDLQEVTELITFDEVLTVRLLRAANSAVAAGIVPVGTVMEAVIRLGTAQVLALAVASCAKPMLQRSVPGYGLEEGALWRHSVAAAVAAEIAPAFCEPAVPAETFTSALLHDVGKLVISRLLTKETLHGLRYAEESQGLSALDAESQILGINHAELGGLIAQHWKLPDSIVQAILNHHTPEIQASVTCDVTFLANEMAKLIEASMFGRDEHPTIPEGVCHRLGIKPENVESYCPVAVTKYLLISRRYNSL